MRTLFQRRLSLPRSRSFVVASSSELVSGFPKHYYVVLESFTPARRTRQSFRFRARFWPACRKFKRAMDIEGTGRLEDGRVIIRRPRGGDSLRRASSPSGTAAS